MRDGRAADALASLRERGRLVTAATADETRVRMVRAWRAGHERQREGPAVMLARRHRDVKELNALARSLLRVEGCLGPDVVIGDLSFAVGDRVIAGTNDRRLGVRNGMLATVATIDSARSILVLAGDDGHQLRLPFSYATGRRPDGLPRLDHGYALTVHRAQGSTWARSYVLASHDAFREEAYTALSRHSHEVTVFMSASGLRDTLDDDIHDLGAAAGRSSAQRLASRIADRFLS